MSVVHERVFECGCLFGLLGNWPALTLGDLDHPLAVDFDGCDLHQSNLYQGEMMIYGLSEMRARTKAVYWSHNPTLTVRFGRPLPMSRRLTRTRLEQRKCGLDDHRDANLNVGLLY